MIITFSVNAKENGQIWNWYYVGISSREPEANLIMRSGVSEVAVLGKGVTVDFRERGMPELKATYVGSIDSTRKVTGELNGFFFDGVEKWQGHYTEIKTSGCVLKELILTPGLAGGDVLVLSRKQGRCQ